MRSDSRAWAQDGCAVEEAGGWEASAASGVTDKVSWRTLTFLPPNQAFTCGSQPWLGVRIARKDLLSLALNLGLLIVGGGVCALDLLRSPQG